MRTNLLFVIGLAGCGAYATGESRGVTRAQLSGGTPIVISNATAQPMCGFYLASDDDETFGDNWLPRAGLPSGQSLEARIKPGRYKATWNTCKSGDHPYFAGTLTGELAFEVTDATQLFAYVADTVAPTKRAAPRLHHALVKFQGQQIGDTEAVAQSAPAPAPATEAAKPARVDMSSFIDAKAARAAAAKKHKPKASLAREHDVAAARAGYVHR